MTDKWTFRRFSFGLMIPVYFLMGVFAQSASPLPKKPNFFAELSTQKVMNGSIVLVTVQVPPGSDEKSVPSAKFEEIDLPFYLIGPKESGTYQAVLGIPFDHEPGTAKVVVTQGSNQALELPLEVVDGKYPSERLKVSKKMVNPPKSVAERIQREQSEVGAIYDRVTQEKFWNGPFQLPINSSITSVFGTKRIYNKKLKNFHGGVDLRAAVGTPIRAPSSGVVVLAKDLYYTGNTVILDHGYGVITIYAHMSRLDVKEGEKIQANTVLGLSGKTGRVNGPHLHWQAVIHHKKINPIELTTVLKQ